MIEKLWRPRAARGGKARLTSDGARIVEFSPDTTDVIRLYGMWGTYAAMWRRQPEIRTCVDFLARNFAQVGIKHFERVSNTVRLELDESEAMRLIHRPSPGVTRYDLMFGTRADLGIYERAYWFKVRPDGAGGRQPPEALVRVRPPYVRKEFDPATGKFLGYRTPDNQLWSRDDLVIFSGYNPFDSEDGVSPIETLRQILQESVAGQRHRMFMWSNAARKAGVIERPADAPEWEDEDRERFRADWQAAMSGESNAGKTAIIEDGMHWIEASWSPEAAQYLEGRKLTREECASAYHLNPILIGILDHGTGPTLVEARRSLYVDTLGPDFVRCKEVIQRDLLPEWNREDRMQRQYVEFNVREKLKGSFEEEAEIAATAVGGPYMSVNEWRRRQDLPPIGDPDDEGNPYNQIVTPLNVVRGGGPQSAPAVPTDVPKSRGRKADADETRWQSESHDRFSQRHLDVLVKAFKRQRNAVLGGKGFDRARWDGELADDLHGVAVQQVEWYGEHIAEQVEAKWDTGRTVEFLKVNSRNMAERINEVTEKAIEDEDMTNDEVFANLIEQRAPQIATSRTTFLAGWAGQEVARQAGESAT